MLKTVLTLFAKPLGSAINNALAAGSAIVLGWAVKQGADAGVVTPIIAGVVNVISLAIAALANTQGVQIPIINADQTNGVRVVSARSADAAGVAPVSAPVPKA